MKLLAEWLGILVLIYSAWCVIAIFIDDVKETCWRFRRAKRKHYCSHYKIIERYGDFQEVGEWCVRADDGTIRDRGAMVTETIKVRFQNGETKIGQIWISDRNCHDPNRGDGLYFE